MVPLLVWTQVSTTLGDLVTLWLIRGCALGPLEASALGGKTYSSEGNTSAMVKLVCFQCETLAAVLVGRKSFSVCCDLILSSVMFTAFGM